MSPRRLPTAAAWASTTVDEEARPRTRPNSRADFDAVSFADRSRNAACRADAGAALEPDIPVEKKRGLKNGSDGTRTRDLRRDQPAVVRSAAGGEFGHGFGRKCDSPGAVDRSTQRLLTAHHNRPLRHDGSAHGICEVRFTTSVARRTLVRLWPP
jgi:hypothetical protein